MEFVVQYSVLDSNIRWRIMLNMSTNAKARVKHDQGTPPGMKLW